MILRYNKKIIITAWMLLVALVCFSQTKHVSVSGQVMEQDTQSPAIQAHIQMLLLPDTTYITGVTSDLKGNFIIPKIPQGKYLLKVSYIGFKTIQIPLNLSSATKGKNLGTISLETDAIMLEEAVVVAQAPKVQVVEDTIVYNSSAYRTPEGAMLEELVKKLPGAEIDEEGNITLNGKSIQKIMVNGKEFFGGDVKTGLKNLPVEMIEKIKTYERKSDLARITGIDDGEEETVIDLTVKKNLNHGMFSNIDVAAGNKKRYSGRGMANYFNDYTQVSLIAGANNLNGRSSRLTDTKTLGISFATEKEKLELVGSARYEYTKNNAVSVGYSEKFLVNGSSYTNSNSQDIGRNYNFNADFRLEWRPDSLTNILFRPNVSYGKTNANSVSESGTFDSNPYDYVENPNEYLDLDSLLIRGDTEDPLYDVRLNASNKASYSKGKNLSAGASLQLNRKFRKKGRNLTLSGRVNYGDSYNDSYSEAFTRYYREQRMDTIFRYNTTPGNSYAVGGKLTYSEPVGKTVFLQFSYQLEYNYKENDRHTYSLLDATGGSEWRLYKPLPTDYRDYEDREQSKYAEYKTFNHDGNISVRINQEKLRLSLGMSIRPQHTELTYRKNKLDTVVVQNILNFSPNMNLRIRFTKMRNLQLTYRGNTNQPGIESLLPVTDNSNPLNIQVGNPNLKPSFQHNVGFNFRDYYAEHQRTVVVNANYTLTQNAVSNIRSYNEETGGSTYTSVNVNGNWNASIGLGINTALKNKKFTVGSNTNFRYKNNVGYLSEDNITQKNTTVDMNLHERISASFRNDWLDVDLKGGISYSWEEDKLRPENNQQPYHYNYGGSVQINVPWRMTIYTEVENQCRRGYSDDHMNKDELVWNVRLSQTLLEGNATLSLEMHDILNNQSNIRRRLTADGRSVYETNGINSYCLVHFLYRLNVFGGNNRKSSHNNRKMRY